MAHRHCRVAVFTSLLAPAALAFAACTSSAGSDPGGTGAAPNVAAPADPAPTSHPTSPTDGSPIPTEGDRLDISGLARWCPGCIAADGGDTTDFGGVEYVPEGCSSSEVYSELTVSEALARGIDLSSVFVGLNEPFEAQVHWREQARSSRVTVTARLNPRLLVWEHLSIDAGPGRDCPIHLQGSVHLTLATDDGSISGAFDANPTYWRSTPAYDRKLALMVDWSPAVQLQGNLELKPQRAEAASRLELLFIWYRLDAIPVDRVGIGIMAYYPEMEGTPCVGFCRHFDSLATAVPPDDCLPWELPSEGVCVDLVEHPVYGAPASPPDAGVPAGSLDGGL